MLVIRLSRQGRRNSPTYRLVVAENSKALDGSFVEIVGNYNSIATDQPLVIRKERIEYWISKGATPSNTVARLLNRVGFNLPVEKRSKAPKKKAEAPKEAAAAPAASEVSSEPVSEPVAAVEEAPAVEEASVIIEEAPATEAEEKSTSTE